IIMWVSVAVAAVVLCVIGYVYGYRTPKIATGNKAMRVADHAMLLENNDSTALAQYQLVADKYGFDAGNRAKLSAAILLYQKGEYAEALNYLKSYSPSESIIGAAAASLEGDCNVNLDNNSAAVSCFKKAVKLSDDNPAYTPLFMMKLATVYMADKNYSEAVAIYKEIKAKYPTYAMQTGTDIEKYIKLAEGMSK
ncbi:MAG: tetratricopeptide repeat protein, partial [Muribaculaceae bacterium]|nr:tetratricopeptide repeat protein [Muribaculaceae bacterium]